ncbi:MAG: L-threonine 3-dehydrogenase [Fimbriimonadaceae bacterium]|nr:MAG: L-threonine 3-dehydrogenase [Fimbriimonadaceae bacterium]
MKAIAKTRPEAGVELIDVPEPQVGPGSVKVRLEAASVCGTDLHIYSWDEWAAKRIQPPRIIGHEFCGTIVEVGPGVVDRQVGDFVASESHITCGVCRQCRLGLGHVCVNTRILGVDVDGGFAPFVVIPKDNAQPISRSIPPKIASFLDAFGNAVHTVNAGPVLDQKVLITGMGPIGMFAAAVCKAEGASLVAATEISDFRAGLARQMGADAVLDPRRDDLEAALRELAPEGFDAVLEMSGSPAALDLAVRSVRPGGRLSLLGVYKESRQSVDMNALVFGGVEVQGIVGRRLWETWVQMRGLLERGAVDLEPVVTHELPYTEFAYGMELMKKGEAGKVVFQFDGAA